MGTKSADDISVLAASAGTTSHQLSMIFLCSFCTVAHFVMESSSALLVTKYHISEKLLPSPSRASYLLLVTTSIPIAQSREGTPADDSWLFLQLQKLIFQKQTQLTFTPRDLPRNFFRIFFYRFLSRASAAKWSFFYLVFSRTMIFFIRCSLLCWERRGEIWRDLVKLFPRRNTTITAAALLPTQISKESKKV